MNLKLLFKLQELYFEGKLKLANLYKSITSLDF